jgi:energy-converting hydrogenase A subunit P
MIEILQHSCTRTLSKFSSCENCLNSCPTDSIEFLNGIPKASAEKCIDCGACIGVCPTDAIQLQKFSPIQTIFQLLEIGENEINCKKNVPCLSALSTQNYTSLSLLSKADIEMNFSHCQDCEIFRGVEKQIIETIDETNFILNSFGVENRLKPTFNEPHRTKEKKEKVSNDKRALLNGSVFQSRFDEVSSETSNKIRNREIPKSRKLFLFATRELEKNNSNVLSSDDLTFLSEKHISENCTNCQICYRICPSHALQSDYKNSFINFSTNLCLKCGLCHDVCEVDAIEVKESFSIANFLKNRTEKLIEFEIRKCRECGAFFTKNGNEVCPRCEIEENEAHELWGI